MNTQDTNQGYQGNWQCSVCGDAITSLPFEPRSRNNLKCKKCFAQNKDSRGERRPSGQRFEGNWQCSMCGNAITSLPFEPRDTSNLKCLDCFSASKRG